MNQSSSYYEHAFISLRIALLVDVRAVWGGWRGSRRDHVRSSLACLGCSRVVTSWVVRMSPRGQAIPDIRERLLRGGERVLMRDGPGGVSARAVASEAGVAAGVLYNHFADLDEFLAELVLDRFRVEAERAAVLPGQAGSRTVAENLADVAVGLLESPTLAVAELVRARLGLSVRVLKALEAGAPGLQEIHRAIVDYLEHERRLGRIAAHSDTHAAALLLVGALHHLLLLHGTELPEPDKAARRVAEAVVAGLTERRP